jgi:nucleoside-diphosphate-sugar epimerase
MQESQVDIVWEPALLRDRLKRFKPDYVFNLAAVVSGVTRNERDHLGMCVPNALLGLVPLWCCADMTLRYVSFSTVCVYPHDAPLPTPELPIDQILCPEPTNEGYGRAKQWMELACGFAMRERPNLSVLVVRPSNLYGRERPDDPDGHVIPRFTWRLLHREDPMAVRGLPRSRRSFLHAGDCAEAVALAAAADYCGTLNVGTDSDCSMGELLGMLADIVGWQPGTVTWGTAQQQGYAERRSDLSRLDHVLKSAGLPPWRPATELATGLAEYVRWSRRFVS